MLLGDPGKLSGGLPHTPKHCIGDVWTQNSKRITENAIDNQVVLHALHDSIMLTGACKTMPAKGAASEPFSCIICAYLTAS